MHPCLGSWVADVPSCIFWRLPTDLVQELNDGTVGVLGCICVDSASHISAMSIVSQSPELLKHKLGSLKCVVAGISGCYPLQRVYLRCHTCFPNSKLVVWLTSVSTWFYRKEIYKKLDKKVLLMLIFIAVQQTTCTKVNCTTPGGRT